MNSLIDYICRQHQLNHTNTISIAGGDISSAYRISTTDAHFFCKINNAEQYPGMFRKEAKALQVLAGYTSLKTPSVTGTGELNGQQYLLLEWLDQTTPSASYWQDLAYGLATLHRSTSDLFGWTTSNYIGSLVQLNEPKSSWAEFYATQRIMPLAQRLYHSGDFTIADLHNTEHLSNRLPELFPSEPPSFLHGDLWSGNIMPVKQNDSVIPSIYDPAVYYGHREMDIGMTLLFGGFESSFYQTYHEIFPLDKNWESRVRLTQLYPLLVHAILFGSTYTRRCRETLRKYS